MTLRTYNTDCTSHDLLNYEPHNDKLHGIRLQGGLIPARLPIPAEVTVTRKLSVSATAHILLKRATEFKMAESISLINVTRQIAVKIF